MLKIDEKTKAYMERIEDMTKELKDLDKSKVLVEKFLDDLKKKKE